MKRSLGIMGIVLGCLLGLSGTHQAVGKIGIEGTLGKSSLGVSYYEDTYAAGMYIGQGQNETPGVKSSAVTLGAWAELRTQIESNLFFAYGVGSYVVNGVSAGSDLQTFGISPFVSFEYYATPHFMLSTWSNIFDYSTTNLGAKTGMPAMTFSKSAMFQSYAAVTYFF